MNPETAERIRADLREGYRTAASETAPARERLYLDEIRRFADYVRERESVLEVGCGDGRTFDVFRGKGVSYAGVDLSEAAVAAARERWMKEAAAGTADFKAGDLLDLPIEDGRFDAVVAAGVAQHVPSRELRARAFAELARVVRPGGYLLIAAWNLWNLRYWGVLLHQRFGRRNGWDFGDLKVSARKPLFPRYYHAFRRRELRALCDAAGLDVVEQYYVKKGEKAGWSRGENLVTIARRR